MKLYWILFPIEDLRQAVETAKRILTKETQLTRQASTSLFMRIGEGARRRVSFDTREELRNKIDKLMVMIAKLAAKDSGSVKEQNVSCTFIRVYNGYLFCTLVCRQLRFSSIL